jgi:hypothetical protein
MKQYLVLEFDTSEEHLEIPGFVFLIPLENNKYIDSILAIARIAESAQKSLGRCLVKIATEFEVICHAGILDADKIEEVKFEGMPVQILSASDRFEPKPIENDYDQYGTAILEEWSIQMYQDGDFFLFCEIYGSTTKVFSEMRNADWLNRLALHIRTI